MLCLFKVLFEAHYCLCWFSNWMLWCNRVRSAKTHQPASPANLAPATGKTEVVRMRVHHAALERFRQQVGPPRTGCACGSPLVRICNMCPAYITPQPLRFSSLPSSCVAPYVCVYTALSFICAVYTFLYVQSERGGGRERDTKRDQEGVKERSHALVPARERGPEGGAAKRIKSSHGGVFPSSCRPS